MHANLIHLRFPFSFYLLPVFLFAWSQTPETNWMNTIVCFIILHLLVYPSSNAYNSYMDKDTGSIGGIKSPPQVHRSLYYITLLFDAAAIVLSFLFFGITITALLLSYIVASRLYSYRGVRIKKYPVAGFLHVAFFQGVVIYVLSSLALGNSFSLNVTTVIAMLISFLLVGAGYPLTQVYQHEQDRADDVTTLSMRLGVQGTFQFSNLMFALLGVLMGVYFIVLKQSYVDALLFYAMLIPVLYFFMRWKNKVKHDEQQANFENAMRMNNMGAWFVNLFFMLLLLKYHLLH